MKYHLYYCLNILLILIMQGLLLIIYFHLLIEIIKTTYFLILLYIPSIDYISLTNKFKLFNL